MRAFLIYLLGNKPVTLTLLYSGKLHGWMLKDFHSRCNVKGRTVSLFQIKDGDCIGGYTSRSWESPNEYKWKPDSSAFLFNLTHSRHFPSKATGKDILCTSYYGPSFSGGGANELVAGREPFNDYNNCSSFANYPGYKIPSETKKGMFLDREINHLTN